MNRQPSIAEIARHESGHAVMAALLGYPAGCIVIDRATGTGWAESTFTLPVFSFLCSRATMEKCAEDAALIALAGEAALPGHPADGDRETARRLAALVAPDATAALLGYWTARADAIMASARGPVAQLATALQRHGALTAKQVRQAIGPIARLRPAKVTNAAIVAADSLADLPGDRSGAAGAGIALASGGLPRWLKWLLSLRWH